MQGDEQTIRHQRNEKAEQNKKENYEVSNLRKIIAVSKQNQSVPLPATNLQIRTKIGFQLYTSTS